MSRPGALAVVGLALNAFFDALIPAPAAPGK